MFLLCIETSNRFAMNRIINAPITSLTLTQTKEGDGSLNFGKRERQKVIEYDRCHVLNYISWAI